MGDRIKPQDAARRGRPVGPSAIQERNVVGLLYTTKIIIIFVGLAAGADNQKEKAPITDPHIDAQFVNPHVNCVSKFYLKG